MKHKQSMTMIELLVGVAIIVILIAGAGFHIRGLMQRARVSAAKVEIKAIVVCLSEIKDDTGLYPLKLLDMGLADAPDSFPSRYWYGPYCEGVSLVDPWGNAYFYELDEGAVFGPNIYKKMTPPKWQTFHFSSPAGKGTLVIDNPGITAARAYLNGTEVVSPDEFKNIIPLIEKKVTLLDSNTLELRIASDPGKQIILKFTSPLDPDTVFFLGSYGKDAVSGGAGYDADIVYGEF